MNMTADLTDDERLSQHRAPPYGSCMAAAKISHAQGFPRESQVEIAKDMRDDSQREYNSHTAPVITITLLLSS